MTKQDLENYVLNNTKYLKKIDIIEHSFVVTVNLK